MLPNLELVYDHSLVNQTVAAQGSAAATNKRLMRTLKNQLLALPVDLPWTVVSSSDSTAVDTSDLWAADSDLVWDQSGDVHSWIVLTNGILQVCIDLLDAGV